jgi:hypothetical protein
LLAIVGKQEQINALNCSFRYIMMHINYYALNFYAQLILVAGAAWLGSQLNINPTNVITSYYATTSVVGGGGASLDTHSLLPIGS